MASNYEAICEENRKRYGTDIGRIGPMLLADRYDDRTHFIFELLQNAEDALGKRGAWSGPRRVTFSLAPDMLSLSHFGRPFDEADVRGVCGIAESTKDQFSIGRFGIGFKSVYTFTDRPEIHSGEEDFTVENYVQPKRVTRTERADDETQIVLPLKPEDATAQDEITAGFKRLGPGALLFLRHIDEINWAVQGGGSGTYLRSSPVALGAIDRILAAFNTDSKTQREKLLAALRSTTFVMVVDGGDGTGYLDRPGNVYIATDRLKLLFAGVPTVMIVDDDYPCLRGEDVRELLEACGALRYPRPVPAPSESYWSDRLKELRVRAGHAETSGYSDSVEDWLLQGFEGLLAHLPQLNPEQRAERARLLWESLGDLEERRGRGIFDGKYTWSHHGKYAATFPSAFVRRLNEAAWVPDVNGTLNPPRLVTFDSLGWKQNPFLLTKIEFKPPIIDQLAKEAGIDPAALDLLRKYGITSVAELASRLGITQAPPEPEPEPAREKVSEEPPAEGDVYGDAKDLYGDDMPDIPPGSQDPEGGDGVGRGGAGGGTGEGGRGSGKGMGGGKAGTGKGGSPGGGGTGGAAGGQGQAGHGRGKGATDPGSSPRGVGGGRPFISYVGTHPDEEEPDPDGLDQATRMAVESQAIEKIIALEPSLQRTPDGNPGFDLYETDDAGKPIRWVEVKSMTGSLSDRPVGMSRTQFACAQERGQAYWLYIVEHARDVGSAQILRIQDPAGHARTFTFDHGWAAIATSD